MKRILFPLVTAATLFACSNPAEDKSSSRESDDGSVPGHSEGDGHNHGTSEHDQEQGHNHDDGHVHSEAALDTVSGHNHEDEHQH